MATCVNLICCERVFCPLSMRFMAETKHTKMLHSKESICFIIVLQKETVLFD